MKEKNKEIKGIPISEFKSENSITTTKEKVLEFFQKHSQEAFSIDVLQKAGFSTNIRKIVQQLVDQEKILQTSYQPENKGKWEYLYHLKPMNTAFDLQKTDDGWIINKISINGYWFRVNCQSEEEPETDFTENSLIIFTVEFPKQGDGILYYADSDEDSEISWLSSMRHSEIKGKFPETARKLILYLESEDLWDFEVESPGIRKRLSKTTSRIESDRAILWAGDKGFLIIIDSKNYSVSIYPRYRELDEEGNVIDEEGGNQFDPNFQTPSDPYANEEENENVIDDGDLEPYDDEDYDSDEDDEEETEEEEEDDSESDYDEIDQEDYDEGEDDEEDNDGENSFEDEDTFDFGGFGNIDEQFRTKLMKNECLMAMVKAKR